MADSEIVYGLRQAKASARKARSGALDRPSLADKIREEILNRVLTGAIQPGERLVEMRIAEEMGTSQAPVREAFRSLEMLGVIEVSRNRGARVRLVDEKDLAEISDVRAELEGFAASRATLRFKDNTGELERHVAAMRQAAVAKDVRRFAEANARFHRLIVETAGNGALLEIWARLDVQAHTLMNVLRSHRNLESVAASHDPIVEALRAGDAAAARQAVRRHVLEIKLGE